MEKPNLSSSYIILAIAIVGLSLICLSKAIESPQYTVMDSELDFEVGYYRESVWMSAPASEISFDKATKDGFHRLGVQHLKELLNGRKHLEEILHLDIVVSVYPRGKFELLQDPHDCIWLDKHCPWGWTSSRISLLSETLSALEFQNSPPLPLPELNLKPDSWESHCIAVRKFSGFARGSNVKEAEKLAIILSKSPWAN